MIEIKVNGDEWSEFAQKLDQFENGAEPVLRAVGTTFKSITEGTFNSVGASFRPTAWPPKKTGGASNLQKSTTLAKSFLLQVSPWSAIVGTPVVYASAHQFGFNGSIVIPSHVRKVSQAFGKPLPFPVWSNVREHTATMNLPARPFMPITSSGRLTPQAEELMVRAGERALGRMLGV